MVKQTKPRTFSGLARNGSNHTPENSGIFSKSGAGQKMDGLPKPSPSSGPVEARKKGGVASLTYAINVPTKKTSMPKSGKDASTIADYALNHGEK